MRNPKNPLLNLLQIPLLNLKPLNSPYKPLLESLTFTLTLVTGMHDKKLIQVVLHNGSTHNFLDLEIAQKLVCKLEEVTPMSITGGGFTNSMLHIFA